MVNKKQTQYNEILNERVKLNWVKVETQVKHHQKKLANNAKDHRKLLWNLHGGFAKKSHEMHSNGRK